jgi:ATP-dependent Lon protease
MIENFTRFVSRICEMEKLPHCTPDGVAAIIEWAVETAGSQNKITLKFSDVADIIREAAYYDSQSKNALIDREVVENAIEWRRRRNDLLDEKIKKSILEGDMLIATEGRRIGQINGLTVYNNGFISFGKPASITASISAGNLVLSTLNGKPS